MTDSSGENIFSNHVPEPETFDAFSSTGRFRARVCRTGVLSSLLALENSPLDDFTD